MSSIDGVGPSWISLEEASQIFGISLKKLDKGVRDETLPHKRYWSSSGERFLVRLSDVAHFKDHHG